ncbi:MAG: nicotinamide-nucleotide adenylyltransferase [Candidatus Aenigmarchaeota archaeon]|nr:nicotinamide-nucleotide adenylyltransferase [Candidatus Aenigmarchaeota archaeon]NIP40531.1 nicotinamide-nucleotide adenylyltransferase [Candidatus Aenigmarchaeota archaeon]NIQ18376.1 nicotinamide-nucleotide adenylyltransferase [Candidatus Aenigmarchaeota archaeon]
MSYYVFKLCKDTGGWELKPKRDLKLDLESLADRFDNVHVKTNVILVTEMGGARISIYPSGRILLFDVEEEKGRKIASRIYKIITKAPEREAKGRALFVGRFQPFHRGHLRAIKDILSKNKEITIVIGSSQEGRTPENPFTLEERKRMIEKGMKEANVKKYKIISVRDFNNDKKWAEAIRKLAKFDVVYTMNPWTERCFERIGIPVRKHDLYVKDKYSGKEIRKRILENREWRNLVPETVARFIRSIKGEERIRKLNE